MMQRLRHAIVELWRALRWSSRATALFHVLAMWLPFNSWRLFFYRLRGTKIGRDVYIVQGVFLEESRPWLLHIEDRVRIGTGVVVTTHDGLYTLYLKDMPHRYAPVVFKRESSICPGAVILPGVTVGEQSIVAPGAVVNRDVPPRTIVAGIPATTLMTMDEALARLEPKREYWIRMEQATRYPWSSEK
jgi:acetyltransferase-like isoleucine patch superfamily enzyme